MSNIITEMATDSTGAHSKILKMQDSTLDGTLITVGADYSIEKMRLRAASNKSIYYQMGFVASVQALYYEQEGADEYPDTWERVLSLQEKTRAFLNSAINEREHDAQWLESTARHIYCETPNLPRRLRKMLVVKTRRCYDLHGGIEGQALAWYETDARFVCNGIVFKIGVVQDLEGRKQWQARAKNAIGFLSNSNLRDLLLSVEHLALYAEVL